MLSTSVSTHFTVDVSSQYASVVSSLSILASSSENSEQVSVALLDQLVITSETVESLPKIRRGYNPQVNPQAYPLPYKYYYTRARRPHFFYFIPCI